jgi:hypothetical protein
MAEAGKKSSTQIWLSDAKRLLAEGYGGASQLAEKRLRDAGAAGRLLWGYQQKKGDAADDKFWRFAEIDFEENLAIVRSYTVYFIPPIRDYNDEPGPTEWLGVWVSRAHVLALLPDEISPPRAALPAGEKRKARQVDRASRALLELYPPDGHPPDEITTDKLHGEVAAHLKTESKRLGLLDPSPTSVARAAGRRPR